MKRGKKLLLLMAAAVTLGIAAAIVIALDLNAEPVEETVSYPVYSVAAEDVAALSWTYEGETLSFTQSEGVWAYAADAAFPLNDYRLNAMLTVLSNVTASRCITAPEGLDTYGLSEPECTVTVTAAGQTQLLIGSENALGTGRYLSVGDGNVYLVDADILEDFSYGLYDLVEEETLPDLSALTSFTVDTGETALTLTHEPDNDYTYSRDYVWFTQTDGARVALDSAACLNFTGLVTDLYWQDCVEYNAQDLSLYGLDVPAAAVTVSYTESYLAETDTLDGDGNPVTATEYRDAEFTLLLGSYSGAYCYAKLQDSSMVYRVDGSILESLTTATVADLMPLDVLKLDLDTVTGLTVTLNDAVYSVERTTETVTDDEGVSTTTVRYTAGGSETAIGDTLDSLNTLTGELFTGEAPEEEEALLSIAFRRNTERFSQVTLTLAAYDGEHCLVYLDGTPTVLLSRTTADALIAELTSHLTGN